MAFHSMKLARPWLLNGARLPTIQFRAKYISRRGISLGESEQNCIWVRPRECDKCKALGIVWQKTL